MSTEALAARRRASSLIDGLVRPVLSPILAVLIAMAVGAILVAAVGENPIYDTRLWLRVGWSAGQISPSRCS